MLTLCPYCAHELKVAPTRKKKCPSCARPIYVKATPGDRTKRLMTEAQAQAAEAEWQIAGERASAARTLWDLGIGEEALEKEKARKGSYTAALQEILHRVATVTKDMHDRQMAFHQLAVLADKQGQSSREFRIAAHRAGLIQLRAEGITKVAIASAPDACPACAALAGVIMSINSAKKETPLPCAACQSHSCRCHYEPVFDDEL